jgi:hypothetical protein
VEQVNSFPAQMLPAGSRSLADRVPVAPPGTIFVLGAEGGYAVPPRAYTLLFGRDPDEVHVPVGTDDPRVSRKHGMFICTGQEWWLRNTGGLPIEMPGGGMLLFGHERRIDAGYTPLVISSSPRRSHLLEVRVIDAAPGTADYAPSSTTLPPTDVYEIDLQERLALTALAQRYLGQDPYPQPMTWQQVADSVNCAPLASKLWTARAAETRVTRVRNRLRIPGTSREEIGQPNVGNLLNHNLILALLRTSTLTPQDLRLLEPEGAE